VKSSALGTILGLVALASVGVLYLRIENLSEQLRPLTEGRASIARPSARRDWSDLDLPPTSRPGVRPKATMPGDSTIIAAPAAVDDRVASLERQIKELKAERKARPGAMRALQFPRFARNVDDLGRVLALSPAQRDRVAQAVERGKRRIEDVMRIPDAEGRSPKERQEERREKIRDAVKSGKTDGLVNLAMGSMAYRDKEIPGQGRTYGEEIERIKHETRDEIGGELDSKQKEAFEDTRIDALVGGGGGASIMMTTSWAEADGESGDGIIVTGGAVEIHEDEDGE